MPPLYRYGVGATPQGAQRPKWGDLPQEIYVNNGQHQHHRGQNQLREEHQPGATAVTTPVDENLSLVDGNQSSVNFSNTNGWLVTRKIRRIT